MITIIVLFLVADLTIVAMLLWALLLRLGLRWAKLERITGRRLALAAILVAVVHGLVSIGISQIVPTTSAGTVLQLITRMVASALVPCLVIRIVFRTSLLRTVQAWVPTVGIFLVVGPLNLLVFRPFLVEAFVVPTNAMAPTILGDHWQGRCARCGQPAYGSPAPRMFAGEEHPLMICNNFHVAPTEPDDQRVRARDHILVAKFLTPRRWDLVVFRYPEEPSTLYVKRLVGLPGETIEIRDGDVWANGERLPQPAEIAGIKYVSRLPDWDIELAGSPQRPAKLAAGEYFVLGDFSDRSKDSRLWEQGAPGHPPYAVPESYLRGVATHIYWPPQRLRVLR